MIKIMIRRLAVSIILLVALFVFLVPVVPHSVTIAVGYPIHYYSSLSSLVSPFGTALSGWHYYFVPDPFSALV